MANEKRLIDANALSKSIKEGSGTELQKFFADVCVATAPTVDAVEVVRCKDCDWYKENGSICVNPKCGKSWYGCRVPEQHFCSYGERKDND